MPTPIFPLGPLMPFGGGVGTYVPPAPPQYAGSRTARSLRPDQFTRRSVQVDRPTAITALSSVQRVTNRDVTHEVVVQAYPSVDSVWSHQVQMAIFHKKVDAAGTLGQLRTVPREVTKKLLGR